MPSFLAAAATSAACACAPDICVMATITPMAAPPKLQQNPAIFIVPLRSGSLVARSIAGPRRAVTGWAVSHRDHAIVLASSLFSSRNGSAGAPCFAGGEPQHGERHHPDDDEADDREGTRLAGVEAREFDEVDRKGLEARADQKVGERELGEYGREDEQTAVDDSRHNVRRYRQQEGADAVGAEASRRLRKG